MAILAGETVTAAKLNRLQPKRYTTNASAIVPASTTADITGCSITVTTETAGAGYMVVGSGDFNPTGIPGGDSQIRLDVDGTDASGLIVYRSSSGTDRFSQGRTWYGTLAAAGSHTLKLEATTAANVVIEALHTTMTLIIYEVV